MAKALRFSLAPGKLHPAQAELLRAWAGGAAKRPYQLHVANSLWGNQGTTWQPGFLKLVQSNYGAGLNEADFRKPEAVRKEVNGWVEKQTQGRIKDLLPAQEIGRLTVLLLTNAVYFKSTWEKRFAKEQTRPERFYLRAGEHVQVPMMRQTNRYGYAETDDVKVLKIDYTGKDLSMVFLLPRNITPFGKFEKSLTASQVEGLLKRVRVQEVSVYLPRFKLEKGLELSEPLRALGMKDAFDPSAADFSGMTTSKGPFLSKVFHKAFVEVNEEGTEAAGGTVVVVKKKEKAPAERLPPVFRADQPFVFLVRDNRNGSTLFLGRVVDPRR
jgi:serpin B